MGQRPRRPRSSASTPCADITYKTTRNEATRCYFCKNKCLRTFIDVKTERQIPTITSRPAKTKVPLEAGAQRLIIATCEKGTVEDVDEMRDIKGGLDKIKKANPELRRDRGQGGLPRAGHRRSWPTRCRSSQITAAQKKRVELMKKRADDPHRHAARAQHVLADAVLHRLLRVARRPGGEPRLLDYTSEELYKEGAKRGAIDPCFPSKLGIPHVHNLLYVQHAKKPLDIIFFPMIDCLHDARCRDVQATPRLPHGRRHAGGGEGGVHQGRRPVHGEGHRVPGHVRQPVASRDLLERQMYEEFKDILGLSPEENERAVDAGYRGAASTSTTSPCAARPARCWSSSSARTGSASCCWAGRITTIPGVNHEILEEFQKLGYPVFAQDSLPIDDDIIWTPLRRRSASRARSATRWTINDVWKNSY